MNRIDTLIEDHLQHAFLQGEIDRLRRFAYWCANEVAVPDMPASHWRALDLLQRRATAPMHPARFAGEAEAILSELPIAATVIGLNHGAPNAIRLLTIAAALDFGPLTAALHASRNHRRYERLLAERIAQDCAGGATVVVGLEKAEVITDAGALLSVSETRCAERQFETWRGSRSDAIELSNDGTL